MALAELPRQAAAHDERARDRRCATSCRREFPSCSARRASRSSARSATSRSSSARSSCRSSRSTCSSTSTASWRAPAQLVPRRWYPPVADVARQIHRTLGGYVRGQLTANIVLGALYATGLRFVDIRLAVPIGVLTGMLAFVPYVGFGCGLLLALVDGDPRLARAGATPRRPRRHARRADPRRARRHAAHRRALGRPRAARGAASR